MKKFTDKPLNLSERVGRELEGLSQSNPNEYFVATIEKRVPKKTNPQNALLWKKMAEISKVLNQDIMDTYATLLIESGQKFEIFQTLAKRNFVA